MQDVSIHPTAVVDDTARLGKGTKVWHFVHVREHAEIGENCVLGHSVYVGKGVKIGDHVKLENRVSLFQGVEIENHVFVGPHVTFTNDLNPRSSSREWKAVPTYVREGASIGAGTVVICGITIGKYAMIGAGSVVTKDVPAYAIAYGNPAEVRGFACTCGRKMKVQTRTRKAVIMRCFQCGREQQIPEADYERMEPDDEA